MPTAQRPVAPPACPAPPHVGARVRDTEWGGLELGTVAGVLADGSVAVLWDEGVIPEPVCMLAHQIQPVDA